MKKLKKIKKVKIKINKEINGLKPGIKIEIETDENGVPLLKYWRRRYADAKIDGCIEVEKSKQEKKTDTSK